MTADLTSTARLDVPAAVVAAEIAEQRRQYLELDLDSACCLPGTTCPACLPADAPPLEVSRG